MNAGTAETEGIGRSGRYALIAIAWLCATCLLLPAPWLLYAAGALAGLALLYYVVHCLVENEVHRLVLAWVLIFPLGYYFLSFPISKPLITLDRLIVGICLGGMLFAKKESWTRITGQLRQAGWLWACFAAAAGLSLLKPGVEMNSLRVYGDAFILPALFGWYVIAQFPVMKHVRVLHVFICLLAIYLAALGALELSRGEELMPMPGVGSYHARSGLEEIVRVKGPFQTNHSFGLVGLISLFFLLFLRKAAPAMPRWQRCLHWVGVPAALMVALLPMFRSIALTLLMVLFLSIGPGQSWKRRTALVCTLGLAVGAFLLLNAALPDIYRERVSSPENVNARFVQQLQNLDLFLENPWLGVGIANFGYAAPKVTCYSKFNPDGIEPLYAPHNNWTGILAETGLLGLLPYTAAQLLLVSAFWKLRREGSTGKLVWKYFLFILLAYGVSGMTLTSGYYGDLNMWFMFTVAALYKYTIEQPPLLRGQAPRWLAAPR